MRKRIIGIAAGALLLAGTASGTAFAVNGAHGTAGAGSISLATGFHACIAPGNQIKNNALYPNDAAHPLECGGVNDVLYAWPSLKSAQEGMQDLSDRIEALSTVVNGKQDALSPVSVASLNPAGYVTLTHVGGTISDKVTPTTADVTLSPGTYRVDFNETFSRLLPAAAGTPETYGTAVLWLDKNNDGIYNWQNGEGAGTAQTGAIAKTPTGSIEASANQTRIVTVTATTVLRGGAFGYNSDTGQYGTGTGNFGASPDLTVTRIK